MASIGLIGLGNAGRPMAERILAKGHSLTVFDIDTGALDRVVQRGARPAHSAGAAVSDITITLLPSSVEVRQAVFGENGVQSQEIVVPLPMVTSLCFGGHDMRDLYIVTGSRGGPHDNCGSIFRTRVDVAGLRLSSARVAL